MKNKEFFPIMFLALMITGCSTTNETLKFIRLDRFSNGNPKFDSLSYPDSYSETYIVSNWRDNKECSQQLNTFVLKKVDTNFLKYKSYNISFYLESKIVDAKHLEENPKDFDSYSSDHDHNFVYMWQNGKFISAFEYKNGKTPGSENIRISLPPASNARDSVQ